MTSPREGHAASSDPDNLERAIHTMAKRSEAVEAYAEALLADEQGEWDLPAMPVPLSISSDANWEEILLALQQSDSEEAMDSAEDLDLRQHLCPELLARYETWLNSRPQPWTIDDALIVGAAIMLGAALQTLDDTVDATVLQGLQWLRQTELMQQWEKLGKRLPIDYAGPNFGGPDHRQRSPGHDVARLLEGLRQIRGGYFQGTYWASGVKHTFTTFPGAYVPVDDAVDALTRLLAHLAADFVTPLSLPLPGWTLLANVPQRDLRTLAAGLYRHGYNIRSGALTPGLGVILVEVILRAHQALTSHATTGTFRLQPSQSAKADEMLLVAQSGLAATSASIAAARALTGEGALALRHLNTPAFARAAVAAAVVISNRAQIRRLEPTSWYDLAQKAIAASKTSTKPGASDSSPLG